jgi:hypothetical protein
MVEPGQVGSLDAAPHDSEHHCRTLRQRVVLHYFDCNSTTREVNNVP